MPRGAFLLALAGRLRVPGVRGLGALRAGEAFTVAVQRLPHPDVADGGHDLRGHQARSDGVFRAMFHMTQTKQGISAPPKTTAELAGATGNDRAAG